MPKNLSDSLSHLTPEQQAFILREIKAGVIALVHWIQHRHDTTGAFPTDAEIEAKLHTDVATLLSEGRSWLDAHPPTT